MDLKHGSLPSCNDAGKALEAVGILYHGQPDRIPTMFRNLTTYDGEPVYRAVADRAPIAEVIIPPRSTAKPGAQADQAPIQRDRHIQMIKHQGRRGWQRATGYGRRSLVETAMFRYKTLIGRRLRARSLPGQKTKAWAGCAVINRMTHLGMPISSRAA